jgi:glyoxylase-like metal-dependent hydrolase (beta-lactamase superfamily II)
MRYQIFPVTAFQQNCSLIWCEHSLASAFVDPGGDADVLVKAVVDRGLMPVAVYLTHGHLDHVGAAQILAEHFQIPIIGPHRDDRFWFEALPQQAEMFGFTPCKTFMPDSWLQEGDKLVFGQQELQVLHTPGHTPGHIVLWHAAAGIVFSGDVLFHGSIGRTDFPRGNHQQLINAIHSKLFTLDPETIVIPGHGPITTVGEEQLTNPFVR